MKNTIIGLLLISTILTSIVAILDIYKSKTISKKAKLNLSFMIFYMPLLGPILYYSVLRKNHS